MKRLWHNTSRNDTQRELDVARAITDHITSGASGPVILPLHAAPLFGHHAAKQGILIGEMRDGIEYFIGKLEWSEQVSRSRPTGSRWFTRKVKTVNTMTQTILPSDRSTILADILAERSRAVGPGQPKFTTEWVTTYLPHILTSKGFTCHGPFAIDRDERRCTIGGERMADTLARMDLAPQHDGLS